MALGRLEEARDAFEQAEAKNLDSPWLRINRYALAFLQNDATGMEQQVTWSLGKPWAEEMFTNLEADTAAHFGHLRKARELSRQAVDLARREDLNERAAAFEGNAALREALFGNAAEARLQAKASLHPSTAPGAQYEAALVFALEGDVTAAGNLADDLVRQYPENQKVQHQRFPTIQASLALDRNNIAKAIEVFQSTQYGAGDFQEFYVRGEAYLAAHRGGEAAAEFQIILDRRGVVLNQPIGALAHLQIGRAYAMQGDAAKAKAAY